MTQTYKAPNGRHCVINEAAKPANPHTLIDDPQHHDAQTKQSKTENKLMAEHVIIDYVGPNGEHFGSEEVRKDSLTPVGAAT
jgi:hypothetical protein